MNKGSIFVLAFSLGAAAGAVVSWKLLKTKYEQIAQEEIDSVKEVFSERFREMEEKEECEESEENNISHSINNKPDPFEYASLIQKEGYANNKEGDDNMEEKPYVISPDEFDTNDYDTESLTYYSDGVLTDDWDNVIDNDDIDDLIGLDSLNHFGEYEDDSVFVRNDSLKTDYEICKDLRKYSEVIGANYTEG